MDKLSLKEKYEEFKLVESNFKSVQDAYLTLPNDQDLLDKKLKEIVSLQEKTKKLEDEIGSILMGKFYLLNSETALIVHADEYCYLEEVKLLKEE